MNQIEIDLTRRADSNTAPIETIRRQETQGAAFALACINSGLPDKTIYSHVGIDSATFSKIKNGLATIQAKDIARFCWIVNNHIYPEWLAYQTGHTLVEIETETQRKLRLSEEANRKKDIKIETLMEAIGGRSKL